MNTTAQLSGISGNKVYKPKTLERQLLKMQIDTELCSGCGACVEACPSEAISLQANIATITKRLCTECGACVEVCPTGALTASEILPMPVAVQPEIMIKPTASGGESVPGRLMPLLGAGLTYLSREIGPRLVDVFINALEHRLDRAPRTVVMTNPIRGRPALGDRIGRRQVRKRKRQRVSRRG